MTTLLSNNEKVVFENVFQYHDPDISTLCQILENKLEDKSGKIGYSEPDSRYVSKLKSTGLKKIVKSIVDVAKSLRLDFQEPKKYSQKVKACISGLNFMINTTTYVIYTIAEGPLVWYVHASSTCNECKEGGQCVYILKLISQERNFHFPEHINNLSTDKKAEWLFNEINK